VHNLNDSDVYGLLINQDAELHRGWFEEMVSLLGVYAKYKKPILNTIDINADTIAQYTQGYNVGCIFEEHPSIHTTKKLGWNAESSETPPIIHVPYDLDGLQIGCLFDIPDALNPSKYRTFRVVALSTTMIYPASVTCKLVPEMQNVASSRDNKVAQTNVLGFLNAEED